MMRSSSSLLPLLLLLLLLYGVSKTDAFASSDHTFVCDASISTEVCRAYLEFYSPSLNWDDQGNVILEGGWAWYYSFVNATVAALEPDGSIWGDSGIDAYGPSVAVVLDDDQVTCTLSVAGQPCANCELCELKHWWGEAQNAAFSADCTGIVTADGFSGRRVECEDTLHFFFPVTMDTLAPTVSSAPSLAPTVSNAPSPSITPAPTTLEAFCDTAFDEFFTCFGDHWATCQPACGFDFDPIEPFYVPFADDVVVDVVNAWPADVTPEEQIDLAEDYLETVCEEIPPVTCSLDTCCPSCDLPARNFAQCLYQWYIVDFETAIGGEADSIEAECDIVEWECEDDTDTDTDTVRTIPEHHNPHLKAPPHDLVTTDGHNNNGGLHRKESHTTTAELLLKLQFGFLKGEGAEPTRDALNLLGANSKDFFQRLFLKDPVFGPILVGFQMPLDHLTASYSLAKPDQIEVDLEVIVEVNGSSLNKHTAAKLFTNHANLSKYVRSVRIGQSRLGGGSNSPLFHLHNVQVHVVG